MYQQRTQLGPPGYVTPEPRPSQLCPNLCILETVRHCLDTGENRNKSMNRNQKA